MAWRADDGQWYDTIEEAIGATNRYRQQEEQIKKLNQQNELIANQNWLIQKQTEEMKSLEREKLQKQEQLQKEQMEHDKEMRILKRFDEVGISKETYDNFCKKLFESVKSNRELIEEISKLKYYINYINLINLNKSSEDYDALEDNYSRETEEEINELVPSALHTTKANEQEYYKYKKLLESCLKTGQTYNLSDEALYVLEFEYEPYKTYKDIYLKVQKRYLIIKKHIVPSYIALAIAIIFVIAFNNTFSTITTVMASIYFIFVVGALISMTLLMKFAIKESMRRCDMFIKDTTSRNDKEAISMIGKLLKEKEENFNSLINNSKTKKDLDCFYKYRINHYNSDIEKLLIDVGFKHMVINYGFEYKSVNNSIKKKNGTIEDYISYFETY